MNYQASNFNENEEFVAYYCRRSPATDWEASGWGPRLNGRQITILEDVGLNYRSGILHACGGDNLFSERYHNWASQAPTGVDVEILHSRTSGNTETTVEETISFPFRQAVSGRKGEIDYRAVWEKATPAVR